MVPAADTSDGQDAAATTLQSATTDEERARPGFRKAEVRLSFERTVDRIMRPAASFRINDRKP